MALKATIFKARLQVSDMDRNHYGDYVLTLARHPSETDERMMVRLLAFALNAEEGLAFTGGISSEGEPDISLKTLAGEIEHWIDVGLPDEKRIKKASRQAQRVSLYLYGGRTAFTWWQRVSGVLGSYQNLRVVLLPQEATEDMATMVQRTMNLQCTVQSGQIWLGDGDRSVFIEPQTLLG